MTQLPDKELHVSIVVDPKYRKKAMKVANDIVYRFWKEAMNGGHIGSHVRDECNYSVGSVNIWSDPRPLGIDELYPERYGEKKQNVNN